MKTSLWDILTGVVLLGILGLIIVVGSILINPNAPYNPLPPAGQVPGLAPTVALPVAGASTDKTQAPDLPSEPPESENLAALATATLEAQLPTATAAAPLPAEQPLEGVLPTLRPSSTPLPTATAFRLPTFTNIPPTQAGEAGGRCRLVSQDPKDGSAFAPGTGFTAHWTLRNTSSDTWRSDAVDLRWVSGDKLHSGPDAYDLTTDVGSDGTVEVLIAMRAPSERGSYTTNWGLFSGNKALCRFYIQIRSRSAD